MLRAPLCLTLMVAIANAEPKKQLDYSDFWTVTGLTHDDTPETALKKWGPKAKRTTFAGDPQVEHAGGGSILFRGDGGIQLTFSDLNRELIAAFPDAATSLVGQTCKEAGARLAFYKKPIPTYLTCKKYDKSNWLLDVTVMCRTRVSLVTVVWYPLPKPATPYSDAHCK